MISSKRHQAIVRDLDRRHAEELRALRAERKDLLDRLMFFAGKPWDLPPDLDEREDSSEIDQDDYAPPDGALSYYDGMPA